MWERILTILRKEFRSVLRDPRMRLVIIGVPLIQTLIFGYAVSLDVRHVKLVVLDRDGTPASRALVARFTGSAYFDAVARTQDEAVARRRGHDEAPQHPHVRPQELRAPVPARRRLPRRQARL